MRNPLYSKDDQSKSRVIRGASWFNGPNQCWYNTLTISPPLRTREAPWAEGDYIGFRLFRSQEQK